MLARIAALFTLSACLHSSSWGQPASVTQEPVEPVTVVRVGVVAVEDLGKEYDQWRQTFADICQASEVPLRFDLALGTYGDLLHWIDQGLIDLAVLTPGIYAEALNRDDVSSQVGKYHYLATISTPAATSKWASAVRQQAGFHYDYRSVCAVAVDSPIRDLDDLQRYARSGAIDFIFVHPLSMSGRVVPEIVLGDLGIRRSRDQIEYSYSHSRSLELITRPPTSRLQVAFVWDDALSAVGALADKVRRVEIPPLDRVSIPHDLMLVRSDFEFAAELSRLLIGYENPHIRFKALDQPKHQYDQLATWKRRVSVPRDAEDELRQVSVKGIGQILRHSSRSLGIPPRLALVLSGGGAKCSYQVGAVTALEEHLAELRKEDPNLDIDLVVGTSGGAINAVPIALGIPMHRDGASDFQHVWKHLDQRDIVRPSWIVRANAGLWFAILQIACVVRIVTWLSGTPDRRAESFSLTLLILGAIELAVAYLPFSPWRWLGTSHIVHHAWLWCTLGVRWSAWCLLAAGIVGKIFHSRQKRSGKHRPFSARITVWTFAFFLVALPLLQIITVVFFQETLSGGQGIETALATQFPILIDQHLERVGNTPLNIGTGRDKAARMQATSQEIVRRGLLKRDLVITGNCLEQSSGTLPSDLYFFAHATSDSPRPPFGRRGIPLEEYPSILLDVVMGSSAIFPLFPPRGVDNIPSAGEHIELIDGGFAHNSPIEAAVLWGATHIILIEATPTRRGLRRNLAENTATAFVHLHKQTQLVDVRSKREVDVFTLTPDPPHMCVLDFADNLIQASIDRGYQEVRVDGQGRARRRFRKELGWPVFSEITLSN